MYDTVSGKLSTAWPWPRGQRRDVSAAALSPGGRTLVVSPHEGPVTAWDARTLTPAEWERHLPGVPYRDPCAA
ncbi:hypothetical protein [Nonomuraea typhae]|uniref:hypothetical protein n=1 Tax=Nonomuraea typhae TaxID=2603600 RepID=UPI0015E1D485|nr:hypothetical protein [Nonomuraea typhae]